MHLRLLGTGSPAPLPHRLGPSLVISSGGEHLLFDAGRGVTTQLVKAGIAPHELTAVFLTHHHYDHIGALGDVLLTAWHSDIPTLPVIGPVGTDSIVTALFNEVYQREIAFSLALDRVANNALRDIREVVTTSIIAPRQTYQFGAWQVTAAEVNHGQALGFAYDDWPCLAYRIEREGKSIVVSGDTVACESLIQLAQGADLLVQCCFIAEAMVTTPYRQWLTQHVIASSGQAGKIATQAGVKALALTHFNDMPPEMLAAMEADVRGDFAGPIYMGEDLMEITV
jgi:ribonuclease Z